GVLGVPDDYKPGEKRAAVIFCHGFTAVKEMWLPNNAARLRAEGYVTLNFDYRYFGESGGEPRSRLIPPAQVTDIRSAMTFMQNWSEWRPEVSFESLLDIMEFKPESVVDRISPRAIMWIHTDKDKLVPLFEAQSMYAKAKQPKKLVVLENMVHDDVYRGQGFELTVQHT